MLLNFFKPTAKNSLAVSVSRRTFLTEGFFIVKTY